MINNNIIYLKKELSKIQNLFIKKDFKIVLKKSKILLKKNPEQPIIYNLIGLSYLELNEIEKALETFFVAIKKFPSDPSIFCNIGNTYKKSGDLKKAREYFKIALTHNSKHVPSNINLGHIENTLKHSELATRYYSEAYKINNNLEEVLIYSILNLSSNGNFLEAKKIISELNNKFPNNIKSYQLLSKIHKYKIDDPHQQIMLNKIKDKNLNYEDLSNLYFALAKSFFDQKDIKNFAYYTLKANEVKFKTFDNYNFQSEENKFKIIKDHFKDFQFEDQKKNNKGENLIFILGLPRSGTTLLHQIISSHSKVFGAEESHFFSTYLEQKFKDENSFTQFFLKDLTNKDLISKLSNDILSNYKMYDENKIILDKMPFNFKWVGFIKILFPNAKVIHSNRNLIESTFSIYRNLFDTPGMGWAYNQEYLIKYVALYNDLMSFWQNKMGNFIYEYHYEKLVANQLDETKKVLKFCNLEFEDQCINYTENKSTVSTVSVSQARQKIYKSSINLSEKYLDYFPFLKQIIKKKAP